MVKKTNGKTGNGKGAYSAQQNGPGQSRDMVKANEQARIAAQTKRAKRKVGSVVVAPAAPAPAPADTRPCGVCKSETAIPALYGFVSAQRGAEGNLPSRQQVLAQVVCAECRPEAQYQENLVAARVNAPPRQLLSCERVLGSITEQRRQAQIAKAEAARAFVASTSPFQAVAALVAKAEATTPPSAESALVQT